MYAIVDIETTGGYAAANGITEIAVFISDGKSILHQYHTLLNPYYTIPRFIESLTGITNEMVASEPDFRTVSGELYELLQNKIFVAHNVNFDYSFLKYHFNQAGYAWDTKKLCTIRLARQIIPGLRGYGLDKICRHLNIDIENRHRAKGDAAATVTLFHYLLQKDQAGVVRKMLKGNSKEHYLPPNVRVEDIRELSHKPGVYYFHDKKGLIIYVGKAKNIYKRVISHFSNNKPNKQKQEFLKRIYRVSFQETATELMAFILENVEIKRIWPEQNKSLKRFAPSYGLYQFEDGNGYIRLCIDKRKKNIQALYTFDLLTEGHSLLRKLIREFGLCPRLCFLQRENMACATLAESNCDGACSDTSLIQNYNERVMNCVRYLQQNLPSFALIDRGLTDDEQSCFFMEKGKFYGMGYLPADIPLYDPESIKHYLTPYTENDYIRGLIYKEAALYPSKKVSFKESVGLIDGQNSFG